MSNTIEILLKDIQVGHGALSTLANVEKFVGKPAYSVGKLLRKSNEALRDFATERGELIKSYGEKNAAGDFIVPKAKIEEFSATINEMLTEKKTLEGVLKVQFKDIEAFATPAVFADLETAGLLEGAPSE